MTDKKLEQLRNTALVPYQLQSRDIAKQDAQSDILVYKEILIEKLALAKTPEECEKVIRMRQEVHELDRKERQLNYTQKSGDLHIQKDIFQRNQLVVASVISFGIGIYFIQSLPLAGLLFLILGLARPLGYSLGEIGDLFDGLTGFPKDSNKLLSNGNDQDIQPEEPKNARS